MSKTTLEPVINKEHKGSYTAYAMGFVLSVILTIIPYQLVIVQNAITGRALVVTLVLFAVAQLSVQLVFFLHLGREERPWWNLQMFAFMALVLLILVLGSLWIMYNLDYNMMSPHDLDQQLIEDEGIRK